MLPVSRWPSKTKKGRQHQKGDEKTDEHPGTRDDAQLCNAAITGRDKTKKANGGGQGSNFQGAPDMPNCSLECRPMVA